MNFSSIRWAGVFSIALGIWVSDSFFHPNILNAISKKEFHMRLLIDLIGPGMSLFCIVWGLVAIFFPQLWGRD